MRFLREEKGISFHLLQNIPFFFSILLFFEEMRGRIQFADLMPQNLRYLFTFLHIFLQYLCRPQISHSKGLCIIINYYAFVHHQLKMPHNKTKVTQLPTITARINKPHIFNSLFVYMLLYPEMHKNKPCDHPGQLSQTKMRVIRIRKPPNPYQKRCYAIVDRC